MAKDIKEIAVLYKGLHANRYVREPMEKRFAIAWDDLMILSKGQHLDNMLDTSGRPNPSRVTPSTQVVAATVIQWLGSEVGQAFLRDVGFVDEAFLRTPEGERWLKRRKLK